MSMRLHFVLRPVFSVAAVAALGLLAACSKGDAPQAGGGAAAHAPAPAPTVGVLTVKLGQVGVATELPGR